MAEGSTYVRMLNPDLGNNDKDFDTDFMEPLAKMFKDRSNKLIIDLSYAKGIALIRYKFKCFALQELENFVNYTKLSELRCL